MWKVFWGVGTGIACLAAAAVWLSTNSVFLYTHPRSPQTRIVVDSATGAAVVMRPVHATGVERPAGQPRVEVAETEFDFGTMNVVTSGRHAFKMRNVGAGPLTLKVGATSCKCTVAGLEKNALLPGEEAAIQLEWTTGRMPLYAHYATILTNDPERPSFNLSVRGKVRLLYAADVAEIVFPGVLPGEPAVAEVTLYSQVWDSLQVAALDSPLAGLTWEAVPLADPASAASDATAATKLRLTIPEGLPAGETSSHVRLTLAGPAESDRHTLELPVFADIQPRISLVGGNSDQFGNIELGTLRQGVGGKVRLLVKVRGPDVAVDDLKVSAYPDFLIAALAPRSDGRGLFDLVIEVPRDAPVGQYLANPHGEVRISTEREVCKLGVTFAVLARERL